MQRNFDLVVIGGGSGGIAMANRAASYGAKVALIEAGRLGGTCVNVGCVPKKIMWNAAAIAHVFHEAGDYGFTARVERFDWPALRKSRDDYVAWLNGRYQAGLEKNGVEILRGRGRFESAHTVAVDGIRLEAAHVAIATGGRPIVPTWKGAELGITSDGFFELAERPRRVAIVGAGYVAVELAGVLRALGSEVVLIVRRASVLMSFDEMLRVGRDAGDGCGRDRNPREPPRPRGGARGRGYRALLQRRAQGDRSRLRAVGGRPRAQRRRPGSRRRRREDRPGGARAHRRMAGHQRCRRVRARRRDGEAGADAGRHRCRAAPGRPALRRPHPSASSRTSACRP